MLKLNCACAYILTSSIRVGVLYIFLDIFWIFNNIDPKVVIISKVIIISASVNLCALEMKIDKIIFWMFAYFVRMNTWFSKIEDDILTEKSMAFPVLYTCLFL